LAARELPASELPRFMGDLEEIRFTAMARLSAPISAPTPDVLLNVGEAAPRLGVSKSFLYRNHSDYSFTRRMGRSLLFSTQGIEEYIRSNGAMTPRLLCANMISRTDFGSRKGQP